MNSDEIRLKLFKMRKDGGYMAHIARGLDPPCSRQAVSAVVGRSATSRRIAKAVSEFIGLDILFVFPEYRGKRRWTRKRRTSNIERPTSNLEWKPLKPEQSNVERRTIEQSNGKPKKPNVERRTSNVQHRILNGNP